jgi:hypothetical protein
MARAREIDHVQVVLSNYPVEVHPDKGLAGIGAPMPQQPVLEVLRPEGLTEQRVIAEINHPRAEIIAGAPIGVHFAKLVRVENERDGGSPRFADL